MTSMSNEDIKETIKIILDTPISNKLKLCLEYALPICNNALMVDAGDIGADFVFMFATNSFIIFVVQQGDNGDNDTTNKRVFKLLRVLANK